MIKSNIKFYVNALLGRFGFEVRRIEGPSIKIDAFHSIREIIGGESSPTVLDVGGNVGQSVAQFRSLFPDATIHSFEPASNAFPELVASCSGDKKAFCWQYALGSRKEELEMHVNERPVFNSIRAPQNYVKDMVYGMERVPVITLDQFCDEHSISFIDILKSDTEGFDSEVFKGASRLFAENRVGLIYFECFFQGVYADVEPFHETYKSLLENGFSIVNFYNPRIKDFRLKLNDTLFINDVYAERVIRRRLD